MGTRDELGAADVTDAQLAAMVADLLHQDDVELLDVDVAVVDYDLPAITTGGRWWVSGHAATSRAKAPFRFFVKEVQSWERSPLFQFVPEEHREMAVASVPWKTEAEVYRSDLARLLDAIDDLEPTPDLHALRRLPKVLREADFKVTAVIVDEALVDVEAGDTTSTRYAIAFDLGTTTVVATLLDLVTGTPVGVASMLNKQQPFGADVISRISATTCAASGSLTKPLRYPSSTLTSPNGTHPGLGG